MILKFVTAGRALTADYLVYIYTKLAPYPPGSLSQDVGCTCGFSVDHEIWPRRSSVEYLYRFRCMCSSV